MEFMVLGSLEVLEGSRSITPSAPKLRGVLAMLVLQHNRPVQISQLIDELWGEDPPASAQSTLQTYIYKLRKIIAAAQPGQADQVLCTKPYGYVLTVPSDHVDVARFEALADAGEGALDEGDSARASSLLSQALGIWRGPALAGVALGELMRAQVTRLEESRLRVLGRRVEADLHLGRHQHLISELKELCAEYPLNEAIHGQLMVALHRSGRRYEALEVYRRFRDFVVDELGLEPTAALSQIHQALLASDSPLGSPELPAPVPRENIAIQGASPSALPAPAQLPADIADFTGRQATVDKLKEWISSGKSGGTGMPVLVLSGMSGVGKTSLAIHLAHQVRHAFPGGQLFTRLKRSDGTPVDPRTVLEGFLRSAGIMPEHIPADTMECSKLFRSWSATRDVLLVLDGAADVAQVQPLLPGSSGCAVIVTGGAHGLPGARIELVDLISPQEGLDLLAKLIGTHRVGAELQAAREIVDFCGSLPLAIRAAGARLAMMPLWPLGRFAKQLRESRDRLEDLSVCDIDVRASHASAYQSLARQHRLSLSLLSLLRSSGFCSAEAADLLGWDAQTTETLLLTLAERHVLRVTNHHISTDQPVRYAIPELTRIYATGRLWEEMHRRP